MATPAGAITTGVVAADTPKEKAAAGSSATLSPETKPVPPWMDEEEEELKENLSTSLDLGGANNAAPKEKSLSSFLLFSPLVFVGTGNAGGGASNTKLYWFCPQTRYLFTCKIFPFSLI